MISFLFIIVVSFCSNAVIDGACVEKLIEPDSQQKYPWRPSGYKYPSGVLGLHKEIEQFYDYMQLTPVEHAVRMSIINRVNSTVQQTWPNAEASLIGSYAVGLALPNSDVDMVVVGALGESPTHSLAKKLTVSGFVEPGSLRELSRRIPIPRLLVTFTDRETKLKMDVLLTYAQLLKNRALVEDYQRKYPVLSKLVLVIKQYMRTRSLNNHHIGGIKSHLLTLMAISFLQMHPKYNNNNRNSGELLIDFFELYGKKFDYENTCIIIRNGGKYVPRAELTNSLFNDKLFCVEDPIEVGFVLSPYHDLEVKQAFRDAYNILSASISNNQNTTNKCSDDNILGRIVHVNDDFIDRRKWVQQNFQHLL